MSKCNSKPNLLGINCPRKPPAPHPRSPNPPSIQLFALRPQKEAAPELTAAELLATEAERLEEAQHFTRFKR